MKVSLPNLCVAYSVKLKCSFRCKLILVTGLIFGSVNVWAATYYSQGTGIANTLANWNTVRAGGGTSPGNFTTANDVFVIQNGHNMTTNAAWALTGSKEKLQVESGGTFTASNLVTFNTSGGNSGTFQVDNGGTYVHNAVSGTANGTANDFTGFAAGLTTLGATSTVIIQKWANAGTAPVALPTLSYGNLTINVATLAGSWNQTGGLTTVNGNLTIQATGGAGVEFRLSGNTTYTLAITGDLIISGGILNLTNGTGTAASPMNVNIGGNFNQTGGTFTQNATNHLSIVTFTGGTASAGFTTTAGTFTSTRMNWVIASGKTLANNTNFGAGAWIASSRTMTVNGSFQINQGSFTGSGAGGTWSYGSTGTLIFNNSAGPYGSIDASHTYWPSASGPANVTVQNGGGITMGVARTVPSSGTAGTFLLVTGTNAVQGTALTLNGTVQIDGGNFQTTPTYGSSSTLIYNTSYGTSNEWTGGAIVSVAAGSGVPANVTVQAGILTLAGGRGVPGNITVNSSTGFVLNAGGDLYIGGNLTNNGSTWTNNSKAVFFVGSGTQTITAGSGTQFFDYMILSKSAGTVQIGASTNITINSSTGDVLQILNAGTLDINGHTLTLNNSGGNILASGGGRTITSTATGGLLNITAAKTVTSASGGTLSFGSNVTVAIAAGVNFGAALSTINGTLKINAGGSCSINSPIYGSGSTLTYNTGDYTTSNEWTAGSSVGTGVPSNVTLTLASSSNVLTLSGSRNALGALTLTTGNVTIGANTLTLNGTFARTSGNLIGSSTSNLSITGTGTLGTLFFDQTTNPTTNGIANLTVNRTSSGTVTLGSTFNVLTAATFTAGAVDVNGQTFRLGGTVSTTTGTVTVGSGTVTFNGTSAQSIPSGFFTSNAAANIVIANAAGVTFNGSVAVSGNFTVNANSLFTPASGAVISGAGTLQGASNITSVAQVTRSTGTSDFLSQYTITNKTLTNLVIEFAGTAAQGVGANTFTALKISNSNGVTMGADVTTTTLNLNSGNFSIGANTFTINGVVSRTSGNLAGGNTSNLTIGGTAGSLFFDNSSTNNFLKALTINTASSATLGNALNITAYDGTSSEGVLTVSGTGVLTTGGFLTIKSNANGTARIAAGNTAGGYISGAATVERFIPQNTSKGWRLLASTTSGQTINAAWQEGVVGGMVNPNAGFGTKITSSGANLTSVQALGFDTLSSGKSLFKYNSATDVLEFVVNTNGTPLSSEQGYFLFIRGDRSPGQFGAGAPTTSTVLRSKGTLFLGDQSAVATGASNYALMRNPYPSRIDMRNIVRGSNLIDAYQVWDAKKGGTYGVGAFQTFTKSGANYVVSPGGGSYGANGSTQNFIESGAAFYIQSTTNTNNTAQVTEACKTSASTNNSYRPSGILAEDKRLSFSLYAINPNSTDGVDGGLVFFNDIYSNGVDINDVRKSSNFSENFGILRNNIELVVERRKDVLGYDTVFFKMYQLRQISYRLDFENIGFDPAVTTAILQDKFTGTNTTLNLSALSSYTFTVSAVAGSFATDRFRLVLNSSNTFSGTGNWTDNARWSRGTPALSPEAVIIAAGANATLNTDFTVGGSLTMTPTSTLVVNPTKTLSISGTANFAAQSVTFKSDNTGYGSLGQVTGTLTGATNVTVERYIPNNGFRSWRLLSVPTFGNGQTIRQAWQEGIANPLPLQNNLPNYGTQITGVFATQAAAAAAGFDSTSVQAGMLSWNGTGWSNVVNTNTAIANNKAYFLFIRGERSKGVTGAITNSSPTTLRTNGTVYTGNQPFSIPTGSFSLAANLYPSAISFTGLTRSNVSNLFYIWDSKKQSGNSLGVYQTFSGTNSFNCLIGGGSYTLGQPNTTIESGQGFFVTGGATAGGGTITLLETAKISGTNGNLGFRPSANPAKIDSRLLDANNEVLDANVVVFDKAYSNAVDADDAVKFGNPGANFAIETNSKILAIEGTQPLTEKHIIQFRMWNLQQQSYNLEFAAANINVQGLYAVLEDSYLHSSTELDLTAVTKVNFTVDANAGSSAANRFRIVLSKNKPVAGAVKPDYTIAPNPVENRIVNLLFKNQAAGKFTIKVLGNDGRTITVKTIKHSGVNTNYQLNLPASVAAGAYNLEIITAGNTKTVKRFIVKNAQ